MLSRFHSQNFFFIVGTGRCGTTALAGALNAHSKVCVPNELQILFEYHGNGERLREVFASGRNRVFDAADYVALIRRSCPSRFQDFYDYEAFFSRLKYPIRSFRWLVTQLYLAVARRHGKDRFGEQTPWYGQGLPLLDCLFPYARYVHLVRDGRDVAISFARTGWWDRDPATNLRRWDEEVRRIEDDARRLLGERMLTLRYEDLATSPEESLRGVCKLLNLDYEDRLLEPNGHIDYDTYRMFDNEAVSSEAYVNWKRSKRTAFFSDSVYAWRRTSEIQFGRVDGSIHETLRRFGYET